MHGTAGRFGRIRWVERHPCLEDRTATTGFDAHYIYHVAWAARVVAKIHLDEHVDRRSRWEIQDLLQRSSHIRVRAGHGAVRAAAFG
jgi:hypothetical protein